MHLNYIHSHNVRNRLSIIVMQLEITVPQPVYFQDLLKTVSTLCNASNVTFLGGDTLGQATGILSGFIFFSIFPSVTPFCI